MVKRKNLKKKNCASKKCIGEDATRGGGGWGGVRGWPDPGGRCTRTPDPGSGHTPPRGWQGELGVPNGWGGPHKIYSKVILYLM
jgi:hypothetical protein